MQALKLTKKYETYPEYKDSGVEWVGKVPKNWETFRAKNLFKKMNRPPLATDEIVTAFRNGMVTLRKNRKEDGFTMADKEIGYQRIEKGDLVIHGMDAFAGAIGVSDSDGKSSPVYSACIPTRNSNPNFHSYLLRHMAKSNFIFALAKGIRERSTEFRFKEFGNLTVIEPSVKEQEKIANYLDTKTASIDQIIEKKQKQIELLKEKRTAVINHAVTKGLDPKVELVESGIEWMGKIPKKWGIEKLKNRTKFLNGYSFNSDEYVDDGLPIVRISDVGQDVDFSQVKRVPFSLKDKIKKFLIKKDDLLVALTGGTIGKTSIYNKDEEIYLNQRVGIVRPNNDLDLLYLKFLLASNIFKKNIELFCIGGAQPNIGKNEIGNISFAFPNKADQHEIASYLENKTVIYDETMKHAERSIEKLLEFKSALISNAVTGKIKV